MRFHLIIVFLWGLLLCGQAAASQDKVCTREEAMQAEIEASSLKDWAAVYLSFKRFSHCDDAAIGEGYSDTVGRLLAKDWQHFHEVARLAASHREFENFVIRHVDETVPADESYKIVQNATLNCSSKDKYFCKKIVERFMVLVRESRSQP